MIDGNVQSHQVIIPNLGINEARSPIAPTPPDTPAGTRSAKTSTRLLERAARARVVRDRLGQCNSPESGLLAVGGIQNPPGHRESMMNSQFHERSGSDLERG